MIKICAMSDLHGYLPEINPCELVLICGDIVPLSAQGSSRYTSRWYERAFKTWAESLPCDKVIFIAGNHELHFPNHYEYYKKVTKNISIKVRMAKSILSLELHIVRNLVTGHLCCQIQN